MSFAACDVKIIFKRCYIQVQFLFFLLSFYPIEASLFAFSDQTPTPTRFLKNCEEVGLFHELSGSFDSELKRPPEESSEDAAGKREETTGGKKVCLRLQLHISSFLRHVFFDVVLVIMKGHQTITISSTVYSKYRY